MICLLYLFSTVPLGAVLDGRATVITQETTYTFTHGEYALGFVAFNKGFNVPAGATIYLGTLLPVNGPINLNKTGRICLSAPLRFGAASTGFVDGGIIATQDGAQGVISFGSNTDLTEQLVLENSMRIDLNLKRLTLRSDGSNRGALMIDHTESQTVTLRNGTLAGVEDFATGFGPRLRGSSVAVGRHGYCLSNIETQFTADATMTVTGCDLVFQGVYNRIQCPRQGIVHLRAALYLDDLAQVSVGQGVEMRLETALTSSYFSIGHAASLLLNNATFSYNKAVSFPAPYLAKKMITALVAQGASTVRALSSGVDAQFVIGGGVTHDYDAFVDVYPYSSLRFDNVIFVNKNSNAGR